MAIQGKEGERRGSGRSPLLFIFLTVFIDLLGFGIVLPLLPVYSKAYGANEVTLGLLFSCFSGMQFFFAPMWGRISDRIGRRPVLIGGLIGTAASYAVFAFAQSLPLLFASRLLAGFFGANISTAQAYIADVTTPENRSKEMGLIGAAFGLGFTLGPLIGGELTILSPMAPGFFACGLSLCAALFGYLRLPEPARSGSGSRVFHASQLKRALGEPRISSLMLLTFLSVVAFGSFEAMFTRFGLARFPKVFHLDGPLADASLEQIMAAAPVAGRYLAGVGVISALIQGGLIRRLVPRFGETTLTIAGPAILGLSLCVVGVGGVMESWGLVITGCILLPIGFGLNNPALTGLVSRASPIEEQGSFLGINQSISSLARMSGPPIAGLCFKQFGPQSPFFVAALVLGCATLVAIRYKQRFGASFAPRSA
ncbi:MAG: MFS transporter [Planctomycetota bacterium]